MPISENIKTLRRRYGLTQQELGEIAGVSGKAVSTWELGVKEPRMGAIQRIADHFAISKSSIIEDGGMELPTYVQSADTPTPPEYRYGNIFPITTKRVPFLGSIACGEPVFANEEHELYVEVGTNVHADFCLQAAGDSMIGARIHDGDIVFIRKQDMVDNGEIAAVIIEDEATLKRVNYYPDKNLLILHAENPSYKDLIYTDAELDQIVILGKAVAFQSDVR